MFLAFVSLFSIKKSHKKRTNKTHRLNNIPIDWTVQHPICLKGLGLGLAPGARYFHVIILCDGKTGGQLIERLGGFQKPAANNTEGSYDQDFCSICFIDIHSMEMNERPVKKRDNLKRKGLSSKHHVGELLVFWGSIYIYTHIYIYIY